MQTHQTSSDYPPLSLQTHLTREQLFAAQKPNTRKYRCWFGSKKRKDNIYYCLFCGIKVPTPDPPWKIHSWCSRTSNPGLGTLLAILLSKLGLTKLRWVKLKRRLTKGYQCGCNTREQTLNRWSFRVFLWPIFLSEKWQRFITSWFLPKRPEG